MVKNSKTYRFKSENLFFSSPTLRPIISWVAAYSDFGVHYSECEWIQAHFQASHTYQTSPISQMRTLQPRVTEVSIPDRKYRSRD